MALASDLLMALDAQKPMIIGFHSGCPDGNAAAYMLSKSLEVLHPDACVDIVPIGHQENRFATVVKPGMIVFSVDISPTEDDVPVISQAHQVFIIDHHISEEKVQEVLSKSCKNVINLSSNHSNECAASLVRQLVQPFVEFDADVVHMFHKMDVFEHNLPEHLAEEFSSFKAFVTQHGERNVSMDLVKTVFEDRETCLKHGRELVANVQLKTDELACGFEVIVEKPECWRVLGVQQDAKCRPIDFGRYQQKIDAYDNGLPTLVLTQDLQPLPNGLFNLGLRRAGPHVDVSKVAANFKQLPDFVGGGGHPFAGVAQTREMLSAERLADIAQAAMTELFEPAQFNHAGC